MHQKFLKELFALTALQAEDYAKAYLRIQLLLQEVDPRKKHRRDRLNWYEEETLELLCALKGVESEFQSFLLLKKVFYNFAQSGRQETFYAARVIVSIRDNYIWPGEIYDDWNGNGSVVGKVQFSPAFIHSGNRGN